MLPIGRSADPLDAVADVVGVGAGAAIDHTATGAHLTPLARLAGSPECPPAASTPPSAAPGSRCGTGSCPPRRTDDVVAIADDLVALHSRDPVTVYLSVLARMANPSLAAVEKALYDDRTLLRHHAMRRTLWVAGPRDGPARARRRHRRPAPGPVPQPLHRRSPVPASPTPTPGSPAGRTAVLAALAETGPMTARDVGRRLPGAGAAGARSAPAG